MFSGWGTLHFAGGARPSAGGVHNKTPYHDPPSSRLIFGVLLISFTLVSSVYLVDYKQGQLAK